MQRGLFEEPTLFSMSALENLTLGRADATEEEIEEALDIAQAGFVHDLPWGLETRIGEQGMSLSGGQRQRLALARAVLAQPRILVLDDTLSALDVHTEKLVEEALQRVLRDATGIVVAHRASTVLLAQAYPASTIIGSDYDAGSIEDARKRAADAGVTDRATFEIASAQMYEQGRRDAFNRLADRDGLLVDAEPEQLGIALVNRYHAVKRAGRI